MKENIITRITSKENAKKELYEGIKDSADVVGSTMGYRGRTVLAESAIGAVEPTKDGYKALFSLNFRKPVKNMALQIAKEASQKTVDLAGDATTCTIVLLEAFLKNSLKKIKDGRSPIDVKIALEKDKDRVLNFLNNISTPVNNDLIYSVALTSANGEVEIASVVHNAFLKAGDYGSVSHVRSENEDTYFEFLDGTLLDSGLADERFINTFENRTSTFENEPLVLISGIEFKTFRQIQPFLEYALEEKKELVIVSDMDFTVKDAILGNVLGENKLPFTIVNPPHLGFRRRDILSDLALVCNAEVVTSLSGSDFNGRAKDFLGKAKKIVSSKKSTVFTPLSISDKVTSKIAELKKELKSTKSNSEKDDVKKRISRLHGGVSIIKVGGVIESELQEKIDRVDDAVCAVNSAKEEGILSGGGISLYSASFLQEVDEITKEALKAPFNKIMENATVETNMDANWFDKVFLRNNPILTKNEIMSGIGYDVKNFEKVNMIKAGIIDATKAIKHSVLNAISASNTILMTDFTINNERAYKDE